MAGFKMWDVVAVTFPNIDRPVRERRPALVIGAKGIQDEYGLLWVLMITSAANRGWPGDVVISDLKVAGLPAISVVRSAKEAECVGSLLSRYRSAVRRILGTMLSEGIIVRGKE